MWIPLTNALFLLFFTAIIFYILPKYPIKWQVVICVVWLAGVAYLAGSLTTNENELTYSNSLVEI